MQHKPNPAVTKQNSLNASSKDMSFNCPTGATIATYRKMGVSKPKIAGTALNLDPHEASSDAPVVEARTAKSGKSLYRVALLHASANLSKPAVRNGRWFVSLNFFDNSLYVIKMMTGKKDRPTFAQMALENALEKLLSKDRVEPRCRFVQNQKVGSVGQGEDQAQLGGHPLRERGDFLRQR